MRDKLALIIALASFGLVTALGVGFAGADELLTTEAMAPPTSTATATTEASTATTAAPQCSNGLDDDEDGLTDAEDPDCESPTDPSEEAEAAGETSTNESVEAPPSAGTTTAKQGGGFKTGESIDGGGTKVHRNDNLGGAGGGHAGGGVTAPPATGGVQLHSKSGDGGSQYAGGGTPTTGNPTTTIAPFGPAPIGVPNFVIDSFEIPPFLLPIYQACGTEYGIPWEVLASINRIETGVRHQPGPLHRRRARLDAVPALELGDVRRRRQRRRPEGPLQPGRRDLRRRPLPEGRPAAPRTSTRRSSPTTTPTGTCRRCSPTPAPTASCPPTWSAR